MIYLFFLCFNVIVIVSILPIFIIKVEPSATCTLNHLLPCPTGVQSYMTFKAKFVQGNIVILWIDKGSNSIYIYIYIYIYILGSCTEKQPNSQLWHTECSNHYHSHPIVIRHLDWIYANLPRNVIVWLLHSQRVDIQSQETFLLSSTDI